MYPSILSFKTINKIKLSFECGIPRPQEAGHTPLLLTGFFTLKSDTGQESNLKGLLANAFFFIQLYSAIAVLATCPRTQGYRKEPLFHTKRRSGHGPLKRRTMHLSVSTIIYESKVSVQKKIPWFRGNIMSRPRETKGNKKFSRNGYTKTSKAKDISLQNPNFHARPVLATFTSMTVLPSWSS
jgi:hypothetical protein